MDEGSTEGDNDEIVGSSDGIKSSSMDGVSVGISIRLSDGDSVGSSEGCSVLVGVVEGSIVGSNLKLIVGDIDG